jgi:voltage-gated potassium channel
VRSTRTAANLLGGRVAWLAVMSAIVVLSASQLLHAFSGYADYGDALHAAALATITGEPLGLDDSFSRTMDVVLASYSVVVFATLAGSLGAFFLQTRMPTAAPDEGSGSAAGTAHQAAPSPDRPAAATLSPTVATTRAHLPPPPTPKDHP